MSQNNIMISTARNTNEPILEKAFDHLSLPELWSWLRELDESPCSDDIRQFLEHKVVEKIFSAMPYHRIYQRSDLTVLNEGHTITLGNSLARSLQSLLTKIDLPRVIILRISRFTPRNLITLAAHLPNLKYLSICHVYEEHSDGLILRLEALKSTGTRLHTLHIDGQGFGDAYVDYLNKIWGLFPSIRVTRFTGMPLISRCELSFRFPQELQGAEISCRPPSDPDSASRYLKVPEASYAKFKEVFGLFVDSQGFRWD
ncbi:hypothetical protein TWF481_002782 [Arthrobotrys musiformis]|uniref:F-box domain-containing protein n=1 Tax=Arthrobotrys musiformis TaxID=47236 RepID=A0AAV9VRC1_9PEZI